EEGPHVREPLDAVVARVGEEDVPARIHGDACGNAELAVPAARAAPRGEEGARERRVAHARAGDSSRRTDLRAAGARPTAGGRLRNAARVVGGNALAGVPPRHLPADLPARARPTARGRRGNTAGEITYRAADTKRTCIAGGAVGVRGATTGASGEVHADSPSAKMLQTARTRRIRANARAAHRIARNRTGATARWDRRRRGCCSRRCGGGRGRCSLAARTTGRGACVTAACTSSDRSLLGRAVQGVLLDLALRAGGGREATGDRVRLATGRMGRALLHEPGTALVREDSVRLLRRAADVRAVGDRPGAVAVLSDCRPGVRDVALVRVGRRLAGGVAGNTADEDSEQRERPEREAARQHDH